MNKTVSISLFNWACLIRELRRRGYGQRESGAFLLGRDEGGKLRVKRVVYYDDIDPHALDKGYIHIDGRRYDALWAVCKEHGLSVVADIHTHPGASVRQSESDRTHPMIPQAGHTAIIVPFFAQFFCLKHSPAAVYRYICNYEWKKYEPGPGGQGLHVTLL